MPLLDRNAKNQYAGLSVSGLACIEFESCHSWTHDVKNDELTEINNFSWIHQRTEVTGQTVTPRSGETDESGNHSQDILARSRRC